MAERCSNYIRSLRRELVKVAGAVGVPHPGLIGPTNVELARGTRDSHTLAEIYGYSDGWGLPGPDDARAVTEIMVAAGVAEHTAAITPPGVEPD